MSRHHLLQAMIPPCKTVDMPRSPKTTFQGLNPWSSRWPEPNRIWSRHPPQAPSRKERLGGGPRQQFAGHRDVTDGIVPLRLFPESTFQRGCHWFTSLTPAAMSPATATWGHRSGPKKHKPLMEQVLYENNTDFQNGSWAGRLTEYLRTVRTLFTAAALLVPASSTSRRHPSGGRLLQVKCLPIFRQPLGSLPPFQTPSILASALILLNFKTVHSS